MDKNIKGDPMKNRTKLCRTIAAMAAAVYCACAFAACAEPTYFYVRNNRDKEITVSVDYVGDDNYGYMYQQGESIGSKTIPAHTTAEFTVSEEGYYKVSSPSFFTKYAYWDNTGDTLVIF